ncbi:hypothetical protein OH77DRAFT_1420455 [Trametes cingulata]|nr:hypothetical protein OH77DRAFT_1420455 [Trametes cingulata]
MAEIQTSTIASLEAEIEETQRQIHRSAELIQSAFEGLTALHNRVTEATSLRAQGRLPTSGSPSSTSDSRNTMDPGHDAIILSSSSQPTNSTNTNPPSAPAMEVTSSSSPRRSRTSDTTSLSHLRTQIMASTESVRSRAGELDDLRRVIVQHAQERRRQAGQAAADSAQSQGTATADAPASSSSGPIPLTPYAALQARYRQLMLESGARRGVQSDESATSLGLMVSARTASSPPSPTNRPSPTTPRSNITTTIVRTPSDSPSTSSAPAQGSSSLSPIPTGIATRLTRLALDIQEDISRISEQSESLMSWMNENRARIDATLAAGRPAERATGAERSPSPSANRTPRPSHASLARNPASAIPDIPNMTSRTILTEGGSSITIHVGPSSRTVAVSAHPTPSRRRPSDAVRALRGPLRVSGDPGTRSDARDGPLTGSTRMDVGSPSSSSRETGSRTAAASNAEAAGGAFGDSEFGDAVSRVRGALARARQSRRHTEGREDEEEPTETRSYRVRRRLNADGDEEVMRVELHARERTRRLDSARRLPYSLPDDDDEPYRGARSDAPGQPRTISSRSSRRTPSPLSSEDDDDAAWLGALRRLDALSRDPEPQTRTDDPRRSWVNPMPLATALNERIRERGSRPGFLGRMEAYHITPLPGDPDYDERIAAMRARALELSGPDPPPRTFGHSSIPPPPPPVRPFSLVSTTQNTPGSLFNANDSSIRVRLRAAVARLDEDMRALDAARERAQSQQQSQSQSQSQSQAPRRPPPPFWADYVDLTSPSPPLERSRDRRTRAGAQEQCAASAANLEQPMWGSPIPFHPSPLPLPLVQDVNSLQARSRVFGSEKKVARMPRRRALAGR